MNDNMKIKYFDEELEVYDERRVVNKNTYSITLNYVPSPTRPLTVENGKTTLTETNGTPNASQYVLDRENGLLLFNQAMKGKVVTINYSAIGLWCISADKVYTNVDNKGKIVETLEDLMKENRQAIESIKTVGDASTVITQLQANIDSVTGLVGNIAEGSSVNEELTKSITSGKGTNITLTNTISSANNKINEMNTWVNQHGDIVNLDNRVDTVETEIPKINEQLEQKANENEVVKKGMGTLNDFDEETRRIIQGLESGQINAVLGKGNVKTENVGDKQITYEKISWINLTRYNLCNNNFTVGYYIDSYGQLIASANYKVSDFIEVVQGKTYSCNNGKLFFARYDKNKTVIKDYGINSKFESPWTCEEGVCYIRVSFLLSTNAMVNEGSVLLEYKNYDDIDLEIDTNFVDTIKLAIEEIIKINGQNIVDNTVSPNKTNFISEITNLFNRDTVVDGLPNAYGNIVAYDGGKTTEFIEVEEGQTYVILNNYQLYHSAYYDNNNNLVEFLPGGFRSPLTIPSNKKIKYIRVGFASSYLSNNELMIYKKYDGVDYVPYCNYNEKTYGFPNEKLMISLKEYLNNKQEIKQFVTNLPKQIELVEGDKCELFYDGMIDVVKYSNYNLTLTGDDWGNKCYAYNRKILYDNPSSNNNKTIKLEWADDNKNIVASAVTNVVVYPIKNPPIQKNVLIIGDSLTDREGTVKTLAEKMEINGFYNVKFIGTRKSGYEGACHEGRSGWKISDYLYKSCYNGTDISQPNPFWYDGECNFMKYCNEHSFSGLDYVIIHLNWNDGWRNSSYMINAYDSFIQRILRDYPDCKIIIVSVPFRNVGQYNTIWNSCTKEEIFNLNKSMENYCENKENIHWINTFLQCDSEYNSERKDINVNIRNEKTESVCVDHVHPGLLGYRQIADAYYRKLNYLFNLYE